MVRVREITYFIIDDGTSDVSAKWKLLSAILEIRKRLFNCALHAEVLVIFTANNLISLKHAGT